MYFILVRRCEIDCYYNLGVGTDINLIGRWGCKHTFIAVRICHGINNC